jgi:glycosyltransferase involved in cell wall biosynthesis
MDISVIVPVLNERESLSDLCASLTGVLVPLRKSYEVILIDDGSADGTDGVVHALCSADPRIRGIHLRRNFGQTAAIMAGIEHSRGSIIVTIDGDLQNDPVEIPQLLGKIDEGFDVVSGWRRNRKDKALTRVLPSKVANWMISLISGVRLRDYGCTLKAYRREVLAGVHLYGEMHRFIPIYAVWQGAKVTEIPVTHHPRKHGKSKYGLSRTFKVMLDLLVIKFLSSYSQKPIYVFGGFGFASFIMSFLCFGAMVYFKYWGHKTFIQTPLPQLVVLFALIGFLSLLMGLVAEIQMRTYYESQGKKTYIVRETRNIDKRDRTQDS